MQQCAMKLKRMTPLLLFLTPEEKMEKGGGKQLNVPTSLTL
jgi:hypothetical protein